MQRDMVFTALQGVRAGKGVLAYLGAPIKEQMYADVRLDAIRLPLWFDSV